MFVKECQAIPKIYLVFSGQMLRACAYYHIARLSTTWKFYASDQTVGHSLACSAGVLLVRATLKAFVRPAIFSHPSLPLPLKSKMGAIIFVMNLLSTRSPKLRLLCRLGTVSNGLNAWQLEIFTKIPLKGSFKLLSSIRCLLRNVKRR